ncbi:hypothetical protein PF011_g587 [Phytophthora fragariae]|uniref:FH2 domain-containing protein n=1 Tax=Phytophthora fragariae TaxID=53985 RepID=A0A6A3MM42_9STRA|nr:hypothetical protein PF011_g587 [Phytophthora fragariae]
MGNLYSSEGVHLRFLDGCPEIPPAPAEDQVQLLFDEFLLSACADQELREEINAAESIETKWAYAFLSKLPHGSVTEEWLNPRDCVELLQRFRGDVKCIHDLFLAIRINMLLRPGAWIEKFVLENGIEQLMSPLQVSGGASVETCNEVLSTLFVLTSSSNGAQGIVKTPECCPLLYTIFDLSSSNEVKVRALKLMGILFRDSSMARDAFSSKSPEDWSLQSLVNKIEQNQSDIAFQLAAVKFINVLLETTRIRKQQAEICEDLKANGFLTLLEVFKNRDVATDADTSIMACMVDQVKVFFEIFDEATKKDTFGALRLALSGALSTNRNDSTLMGDRATGNQGENDGSTNPEQEQSDEHGPNDSSTSDTAKTCTLTQSLNPGDMQCNPDRESDQRPDRIKTTTRSDASKSINFDENAMTSSSPDTALLEAVFGQLQQHTKKVDQETNEKLTNLLQKIALSLSDESEGCQAFDRLEKMFASTQNPSKEQSDYGVHAKEPAFAVAAETKEPDLLTRVEPTSGPGISKFKKLLAMGAPLAAVKAKMTQAGLDPALLDGPSSAVSPASSDSPAPSVKVKVKDDPSYAKFFKLLSMGAPSAAVKAKMVQAGLNSALLDTPDADMPTVGAPSDSTPPMAEAASNPHALLSNMLSSRTPAQTEAPVKVKDDPQYAKFFKLLSMGAPAESVKAKMRMAGLQLELLDTPDAPVKPAPSASNVGGSQPESKVKDDPAYAKFFKLLSMGAPAESVKAKMRMAGLNSDLLDTPDASLPSSNTPLAATRTAFKVKDDPGYAKFFKLLSMGAPAESVKAKMQMAGLKPELLDTPDADLPSVDIQAPVQPQVKVKDDPAYAKFFKLLEMGAPAESVKAKMRMAGLQGDLLDTPDAILPSSTSTNQPAAPATTTTAARRAHLSIAIKPVVKAKTRAFYWQHLKTEAIKGTIWEELEKEHSNQSNQDRLTLTESELELLETEFPPPAACGPSTGTRRGSMSGIGSPGGPASPLASPRIVFLIDRARSNNISIIVKQFKMSNAALRVAIMKMDSEVLTLDRVQGLIKILPTEEEIAAITGFNGDPTTLNGAELVLKELITVPRLKQRLSALETKHQFPAWVRDLQTKINKIRVACNEIALSSEFKTILLVILQVGNKMNQGTARGGAKGFRLNDLTKLVQLKSVDRTVTLLHYVARMIRTKKGNVVRLGDSLASLYDVQSIPIPELQGDMNRINDITENINVELAAQRLKNRIEEKEENDLFVESMTVFVDEASKDVATLKTDLDETLRLMRDIMLRFDRNTDEDEASPPAVDVPLTPAALTGAGEFFSVIYEFTMSLMKADRENEIKRIREEKRLKQQELKNATPRRNSVDRVALKKLNSPATPEPQDVPRRKSMLAVPSSASFKSEGVSSLLPGIPNNPITANLDGAVKPDAEPESSTPPETQKAPKQEVDAEKITLESTSMSKLTVEAPSAVSTADEIQPIAEAKLDLTMDDKVVPKPTGIPKPALKVPGKILVPTGIASPLKKVVGATPTGIPSPLKFKRTSSSCSSLEKTGPFDAASLNEIKKTKHTTNNELRTLKPEVETEVTATAVDTRQCPLLDEFRVMVSTVSMTDFSPPLEIFPTTDTIEARRRLSTDALNSFRAIDKKGLRGFLEGGVFSLSTPLACAEHCIADPLCLSFDFETVSFDCYISHSDRYAHPEAYLDFPTGVYYEWQGVVDAPEIEPSGGLFNTQIVVRLLTAKLGAEIHYHVISSTKLVTTNLTATGLFGTGQNFSVAASGDIITLPKYSCKIYAIAAKEGMNDSTLVVSNEYQIFPSKYVYLVPNFNGEYHGRVARIELDLKGKKRPRPARFLEFSDYETPNGIGPYDGQVNVIDMSTLDLVFKGFYGGFTAFSKATFVNETYLVPAADDPKYSTTEWRVALKAQYTPSTTHSGFGSPAELERDVEYLYLVPFYNGTIYASKVLRVLALTFASTTPIVETLDVGSLDKSLKGFGSSFSDGSFGYLVPRENESGLFGKLVRFRIDNFTTASVEVLNLTAIDPRYVGFSSAFTYGAYAYMVPFRRPLVGDELTMNLREFPVSSSGLVVRVDLSTFRVAGSLDLAGVHPDLCGFSGAVTVTHFAYFIPYMRVKEPDSQELNPYSGLVGRVDLRDFSSVQYLNLTAIDSGLRGFMKGFAYRQYVFLVPHRSSFYDPMGPAQSGKVARIDTRDFSLNGVSFLDLTAALRSQVPDFADTDLRGFNGGVVSGKYGFFVPYFNGATFSGKVCRINLDKFDEVQTLDLTQLDSKLRGFADGILSRVEETLEANLFDEFQIRLGTTDPYDYHY